MNINNEELGFWTSKETVAGTYNGQTLYKKTFSKSGSSNASISMGPVPCTYSKIRGFEGFHIAENYLLSLMYDNQSGNYFKCYIGKSSMNIVVDSHGYGAFTSYITVYYVK